MKSAVIVFILCIFAFTSFGWSEVKYFKIPKPEKKADTPPTPKPDKPEPSKTEPTKEKPATKPPASDSKSKKKQRPAVTKTKSKKKRKPSGPYFTSLQISSFKTLKQAEGEDSRLKSFGVDSFIRHETVRDKGKWYRVYAGRFNSRRQALDYERELKRRGIIRWSWVKRLKVDADQVVAQTPPPDKQRTEPAVSKPKPKDAAKTAQTKPKKKARVDPMELPDTASAAKAKPTKRPSTQLPPPESKKTKPAKKPAKKPKDKDKPKDEERDPGRFSAGIRAGVLAAVNASDFRITKVSGTDTENFEFESNKITAGLTASWRFSDCWAIDLAIEQVLLANLDLQFISLGPKMYFTKKGASRWYLRSTLIYGNLAWDEAPGDFDSALGADLGFGIDFFGERFCLGIETAYRYLTFDYNRPSGTEVTATDSKIDFSGMTLNGVFRYHF